VYDVRTGSGDQMSTANTSKSVRLDFRASSEQRILLERAAAVASKSLTEFVLETACAAAESTLLDQRFFFVDKADFDKFEKALEAPAKSSKELRELLSQPAPWE